MSRWERFKCWLNDSWIGKFWKWLTQIIRKIYKPIVLIVILTLVWYGFLNLVSEPPLDATPVLIMLWATAAISIFALFPSILKYIRRVKIGDIEIELKESVEKSTIPNYITIEEITGTTISATKGGTENLKKIILQILQEPDKPVMLSVNIGPSGMISNSFLFVYLFLMDVFCDIVIVVFVNKKAGQQGLHSFRKENVIGIISGKELLLSYYRKFPILISGPSISQDRRNHIYEREGLYQVPSSDFIEELWYGVHESMSIDSKIREREVDNRNDSRIYQRRLTVNIVKEWLQDKMKFLSVDTSLETKDIEAIRQSLYEVNEFLLVTKEGKPERIAIIDVFSRNFTKKILDQMKGKK